jgi:hypothetical protein
MVQTIEELSSSLQTDQDLDPLIESIGDARYVLLGEASHGTSEFYTWRARITRRLIVEKDFNFIAVEGDWPDCYQINRFIKGYPDATQTASETLQTFKRWPTWMWANWEVAPLAEWLRRHNHASGRRAGFYGLDVYSLWESMEAILEYLEKTDPQAAQTAREAYACFALKAGRGSCTRLADRTGCCCSRGPETTRASARCAASAPSVWSITQSGSGLAITCPPRFPSATTLSCSSTRPRLCIPYISQMQKMPLPLTPTPGVSKYLKIRRLTF